MKKHLRYVQTFVPFLRPAKFALSNHLTRHYGLRTDIEFRALAHLGPIELALDIGGNWGQSIHALERCASPRRIVSIEPNYELALRLKRAFSSDLTVQIIDCALSDAPGEMRLFVPRYRQFVYDGLASIDRDEACSWLNSRTMAWFNSSDLHIDEQTVTVMTLDGLSLAPDVIKIDVQGVEELVVRGGHETFLRYRPACIIERPSQKLTAGHLY